MKRKIVIINRTLTAALFALALTTLTLAQGSTQSVKGVVVKGKAPVNKEILKVSLPKPYETKLSNGLQVIVLENHKLPTFSMQLVVLSGGFADSTDLPGVAQYTATMLREGTKTRSSKQIAEQIDSLGASLFAGSGLSSTTSNVTASGLVDNLDQVMEMFADVILNPSFPADEFNRLKTRGLAQLRFQRSQPGFLAGEMFSKVMYGAHPASRFSLSAEQIQRITSEMLQKFHATNYKPNNAILAVVGDVKPADLVARLNKYFGSWQSSDVPATNIPKVSDTGAAKIHLIHRPGSVQTNLVLGSLTIERTDPDYYALEVMNQIIGGNASARLFLNLREDKGYTYGAYSNVSALKYRGVFRASTEVRSDVTDGSMKELLYEIKRLRDEQTPATEFENAKRTIVGSFALELESPQAVLGDFVTQKLYGLPADYWDTYPQKIAAVTAADVQRVARKYLDLDKLQIVAVGDATKITDVLKKYGAVEVFDAEGKPFKPEAPAAAAGNSGGAAAGIAGAWTLTLSTPQGELPVKAMFKQNGADLSGTIDTPFGQFPITSGKVSGSDVTFTAKIEVQGQQAELLGKGKVEGNSMKGSVSSAMLPEVPFTGKREN